MGLPADGLPVTDVPGLTGDHLCHCPHCLDQLLSSRFVGPTPPFYQRDAAAGSEKTVYSRFVPTGFSGPLAE